MNNMVAEKDMRIAYGEALVQLGHENADIVVVDADMSPGTMTCFFKDEFPERFFDVGIAEQNLVGVGAGLSLSGLIPFINTYAWLLTLRAGDPLRSLVAYPQTNVKVIAGYGGLTGSMDGSTHSSIEDLAVVRALPGMTVMVASDASYIHWAVRAIADFKGPVYLRLSRAKTANFHEQDCDFQIGKGIKLKEGKDLTIFCNGLFVLKALSAAELLEKQGIDASVVEIHTIKPLDKILIVEEIAKTGAAIVVEEHNIIGGLGSAIAELAGEEHPVPVIRVGIADTFCGTGPYEELFENYGLSINDIVDAGVRCLKLKDLCLIQ